MIEMGEDVLRFIEGRRREDLDGDRMPAHALARALEFLGEAASKVAPETRRAMPEIA